MRLHAVGDPKTSLDLMVRKLLLCAAAVAVLAVPAAPASAAGCKGRSAVPTGSNDKQVRHAVLCLLNAQRRKRGLKPLRENSKLRRAAKGHSRNMVQNSFFDHVSPSGSTMTDRVKSAGYIRPGKGYTLGENIAWGTGTKGTARSIVHNWMRSPGHRANILHREFREIGIGIRVGAPVRVRASKSGATYTTNFGRRY